MCRPTAACRRERWRGALNAHLPPAIRVRAVRFVPGKFQRVSARGKIYRYRIWNAPVFDPFEIGRAWHVPGELDLDVFAAEQPPACRPA